MTFGGLPLRVVLYVELTIYFHLPFPKTLLMLVSHDVLEKYEIDNFK